MSAVDPSRARQTLEAIFAERILVLDGAMGTMIQRARPRRGRLPRRALPRPPARPEGRQRDPRPHAPRRDPRDPRRLPRGGRGHHRDQHVQRHARSRRPTTGWRRSSPELNRRGARGSRVEAAAEWIARTPERPRFVAGAIGPTNKTLSISPDVNDAGFRAVDFDADARRLRRAGARAARGRRRPAPGRDDLRHAEREGRDRRDRARCSTSSASRCRS